MWIPKDKNITRKPRKLFFLIKLILIYYSIQKIILFQLFHIEVSLKTLKKKWR